MLPEENDDDERSDDNKINNDSHPSYNMNVSYSPNGTLSKSDPYNEQCKILDAKDVDDDKISDDDEMKVSYSPNGNLGKSDLSNMECVKLKISNERIIVTIKMFLYPNQYRYGIQTIQS